MEYKPLLIAVGQSGAYSENMLYTWVFDTKEEFGLYVKHVPFKHFGKIKNIITQDWKDQDGEDVYIPSQPRYEAYDMEIEFAYFKHMNASGHANDAIRDFVRSIEGKWLKIYDTYTGIGRQGVYLVETDDEPTFLRRGGLDCVVMKLKFRVNDPWNDIYLEKPKPPVPPTPPTPSVEVTTSIRSSYHYAYSGNFGSGFDIVLDREDISGGQYYGEYLAVLETTVSDATATVEYSLQSDIPNVYIQNQGTVANVRSVSPFDVSNAITINMVRTTTPSSGSPIVENFVIRVRKP